MSASVTSVVRIWSAVVAGATLLVLPSVAGAVDLPRSLNQPPQGPGTESTTAPGRPVYRQGLEAGASLGTGFSDTYGLGVGARLGYTFSDGVYAGADVQHYLGRTINDQSSHATFVGGEVGYKFYPSEHVEIRPFVFAGPAFITQVRPNPLVVDSLTGFAVQPGVVAQYHFGNAYVGGDAHYMVTPAPNTLAIMANAGIGF